MMTEESSGRRRGNNEGNQFPDRLLTVREVADLLHVHTNTARRWSDLGLIKSYRVGPRGDRRFRAEDLNSFITTIKPNLGGAALIVDDDPGIRQLMTDAIMEQGYKVVAVDSGESALEELDRQRFDLIFLDLVLPRLSGVEVLRNIKERSNKTMVAVITGYGDDPVALEAMSMGPLFFIRKPFQMSEITEVLDAVMRPKP
ncbi:MAG: response regulator [Dehalococcoidia bacterium]|nr:response regulator [Dehalococcoidia bacterium]